MFLGVFLLQLFAIVVENLTVLILRLLMLYVKDVPIIVPDKFTSYMYYLCKRTKYFDISVGTIVKSAANLQTIM